MTALLPTRVELQQWREFLTYLSIAMIGLCFLSAGLLHLLQRLSDYWEQRGR